MRQLLYQKLGLTINLDPHSTAYGSARDGGLSAAIGLPKLAFVDPGAWFFLLVNAFKVPCSAQLGLITPDSLKVDAVLLLPMIPDALLVPLILRKTNQAMFENMVRVLAVVASLRLLF